MGQRNDLRKEVMGLPDDGSVMTADDIADYLVSLSDGWALLKRFTAHHNAIVNNAMGTEELTHDVANILNEPVYKSIAVQRWIAVHR